MHSWKNGKLDKRNARQPLQSGIELVRSLEAPFLALMAESAIPQEFNAHAAAFTGMLIIQMGQQTLNPDITKAIALSALVAGSKPVPFARIDEG